MPKKENPISELDSIFIEHSAFTNVVEEAQLIIGLHGKMREAPNLCITGPSGIGKSTLLRKLESFHPRVANARTLTLPNGQKAVCDYVPLLRVEMPSRPTANSLARALLKAIGDPDWRKGARDELIERLQIYIKACGVRAIPIDEAQRAVDRDGIVVEEDLAEWLKELHNKLLNVSFFLVGMGRVKYLLNHDDQVDRRWDDELPMPPYDWGSDENGDPESRLAFIALLVAYKNACPIPFSPDLDVECDEVALRFFYAARGVVGLLKKLMMKAVVIATALNSDVITNDILRRAYDRAFRKEKEHEKLVNPWAPNWDGRLPPPLRDHTVLRRSKKKTRTRKNDRRAELTSALTKR